MKRTVMVVCLLGLVACGGGGGGSGGGNAPSTGAYIAEVRSIVSASSEESEPAELRANPGSDAEAEAEPILL